MKIVIDLLLIAIIVVNITDISDLLPHIEEALKRWLKRDRIILPKIIRCSYCQTHWLCLLYLLITSQLSLATYALTLFICFLTPIIMEIQILIRDLIIRLLQKIE